MENTNGITIRIPRRLMIAEDDDCITVRFPNANDLLIGIMMEMTNEDPTKAVAMKVNQ